MSSREKVKMLCLLSRMLIALLIVAALPISALSAELLHTVQVGSHLTENRALRQFDQMLALLSEQDREVLRIEKLTGYYVLRVGGFTTAEKAQQLLTKVHTSHPGAILITAYISRNRLVKIYRSDEIKAQVTVSPGEIQEQPRVEIADVPAPALIADEETASRAVAEMIPEPTIEKPADIEITLTNSEPVAQEPIEALGLAPIQIAKEAVENVAEPLELAIEEDVARVTEGLDVAETNVEEVASVIVLSSEEPSQIPAAEMDAAPVPVEEPMTVVSGVETLPISAPTGAEVEPPADVDTVEEVASAKVELQDEPTTVASPVKSEGIDVEAFLPSRLVTVISTLLLFCGIVLTARVLKSSKGDQAEKDVFDEEPALFDVEKSAVPDVVPAAELLSDATRDEVLAETPGLAERAEIAEPELATADISNAKEENTRDDFLKDALGPVDESPIKAFEEEAPVAKPAPIAFAERDVPATDDAESAKEDRRNRVSRAMEAAVFGEKGKR